MKSILLVLFLFVSLLVHGQIESSELTLSFGTIKEGDNRVKEIVLTNNGDREETLIRIGASESEFDIKYSTQTIPPGRTVTIRIKYNPRSKGLKNYDIPIYFSRSNPLNLKVSADVNYLEWEDYTPCPDFENTNKDNSFTIIFKVVDSSDGKPIKNADVLIAEQGIEQARWKTNKKGTVEREVPLSYYSMLGRAEGYNSSRKEGYINRRNRYFIFALDPIEKEERIEEVIAKTETPIEEIIVVEELPKTLEEIEEVAPDPRLREDNSEFSLNTYSKNNVVFLIDVSTSMKREERLEILKSSMIKLLEMLRPEDRLSIITYASSTDVVLKSTFVNDKKAIAKIINDLEGKGLTAGETGIKKAYSIVKKYFIEGGNNQVYLATDGAFNKGETDVSRFVRRQKKNGIYMSIIAVKSPDWTIPKMKKISKDANGDYLPIEDFEMDEEKLKELVKSQSRISN